MKTFKNVYIMFKVKNKDTRILHRLKTQENNFLVFTVGIKCRSGVFIFNFENVLHIFQVFL